MCNTIDCITSSFPHYIMFLGPVKSGKTNTIKTLLKYQKDYFNTICIQFKQVEVVILPPKSLVTEFDINVIECIKG